MTDFDGTEANVTNYTLIPSPGFASYYEIGNALND
jgi:hypothetical protein